MNGEAGSREVMLGSLVRAVLIPGGSEATSWGLELVKDFPSSRSQRLACEPFNPATTSKNDGGKPQPPHQRKAYPTSPTCAGAGGSFIKKKRRKKNPHPVPLSKRLSGQKAPGVSLPRGLGPSGGLEAGCWARLPTLQKYSRLITAGFPCSAARSLAALRGTCALRPGARTPPQMSRLFC